MTVGVFTYLVPIYGVGTREKKNSISMEFGIFYEGYYLLFHPKFHPMKSRYVGTYLILVLDPTYVAFLRGTLISFPSPHHVLSGEYFCLTMALVAAGIDATADQRPVQARKPHLEVRGKVAYAWLGRILAGELKI